MIQQTHKTPKIALCRRCGGRGISLRKERCAHSVEEAEE